MSDGRRQSEEERARRHGSWPVRKFVMGDEPGDDLSETTTPEERLAMVWPLTLEAWRVAALPLPDYPRDRMPVTCRRPGAG